MTGGERKRDIAFVLYPLVKRLCSCKQTLIHAPTHSSNENHSERKLWGGEYLGKARGSVVS